MARIVVDDITGVQYTEEEWEDLLRFELHIIRPDGSVMVVETASPGDLARELVGGEDPARAVGIQEEPDEGFSDDPEEDEEEPEEPRVKVKPLTDAEMRERERQVREMNHGISDIRINNVEL